MSAFATSTGLPPSTYLRLRCTRGHGWKTTPNSVIYHRERCPDCAKLTIEDHRGRTALAETSTDSRPRRHAPRRAPDDGDRRSAA